MELLWIGVLILSVTVIIRCSPIIPAQNAEPDNEDADDSLWLEDYENEERFDQDPMSYDALMQADSPHNDGTSDMTSLPVDDDDAPTCPPSSPDVAESLCHVMSCDVDNNICAKNFTKCCYNGCIYTCLLPVQPVPYIDWKREPYGRLHAGRSWLIPGPSNNNQVEWCSTTEVYEDDEEPLLCPQGFTCHIEDIGDLERRIPNQGRCVPTSTHQDVDTSRSIFRIQSKSPNDNTCHVINNTYKEGDTFTYYRHTCQCISGSILCRVGKTPKKDKKLDLHNTEPARVH